jgi:hypothetical protein
VADVPSGLSLTPHHEIKKKHKFVLEKIRKETAVATLKGTILELFVVTEKNKKTPRTLVSRPSFETGTTRIQVRSITA